MNYTALKAAYQADQVTFDAMTAQAVADALNAATVERNIPAPMRELLVYLLTKDKWAGIVDAADGGASPVSPVRRECLALVTVASNPNFEDLDLSLAAVQGMLLNIKNAGLLDAADQAAILALAKETVSPAAAAGVRGAVLARHVVTVRGML